MRVDEIYARKQAQGRQVLSFEIFPPKRGTELRDIDATLEVLADCGPDFISVTFGAGGSSNNNRTIELARKIKEQYHVEPVVHLTCLTYSRQEIDEFCQQLDFNGIENVFALRGDRNPNVPAKEDFAHASQLSAYLREKGNFCIGGACYPECHPESESRVSEMLHLKEKVVAGASYLLSQLFFENDMFYAFLEDCRICGINVPVTPGIMPVINKAQIERMVSLCSASLPARFCKIMDRFEDDKQALFDAGMAYATSQIIDLLAQDVDGIHLYTMNNPAVARRICDSVKNIIGG